MSTSFAEPGSARYLEAVAAYNLAVEPRPSAAATVHGLDELRDAVLTATAQGRRLRVTTTGHGVDAVAGMDGDLLVRLESFGPVEIDPAARTATVPAGTRWSAVIDAAAPFGLAAMHGSSPTVGVIGYLMNGGLSFYGRKHGIAASSVLEASLMTASGEVVRLSADHDKELFDALRGGGGGFGIVVSVTIALHEAENLLTGASFWPGEHAGALLDTWDAWCATAPEEITTAFRILNLPPLPGIPAVLTRGPVVCIDGAALPGGRSSAGTLVQDLLEPLRAVAVPLLETWHSGSPADLAATHMDPPDPAPYAADHFLVRELPEDAREALVQALETTPAGDLTIVELRQLGGAFARRDGSSGVLGALDAQYSFNGMGITVDADGAAHVSEGLAATRAALRPWDAGFTAPTVVGGWNAPQKSFAEPEVRRIHDVRRRVDPTGVFAGGISAAALLTTSSRPTDRP